MTSSRERRLSRLESVHMELENLNNEINDINEFLLESSDDEEQMEYSINVPEDNNSSEYRGTARDSRLYKESLAIMEKRNQQIKQRMIDEDSLYDIPKSRIKVSNYKPPSERIEESIIKRNNMVKKAQAEREEKFNKEYTFKPKINKTKQTEYYDRGHLLRPPKRRNESVSQAPKRLINKKSEEIAQKAETERDFLTRQFRKERSKSVNNHEDSDENLFTHSRKLTADEQRDITERLSRPRPMIISKPTQKEKETPKRHKADPETFERLVSSSVKSRKESETPKKRSKPVMNAQSRRLTEGLQPDLFESSISAQRQREQFAQNQRDWQELQELTECTFRPRIIHGKPIKQPSAEVAGMDDYVDRMKETRRRKRMEQEAETSNDKSYRPRVLTQRPFSFEAREPKSTVVVEREVDGVLSEINKLLNGF